MKYFKSRDQKLKSLKSEIQKGIDSKPSETLDMKAVIAKAKSHKQ